jgi:hypothetical protein
VPSAIEIAKFSDDVDTFAAVRPGMPARISDRRVGTSTAIWVPPGATRALGTVTGRAIDCPVNMTSTMARPSSSFMTWAVSLYGW